MNNSLIGRLPCVYDAHAMQKINHHQSGVVFEILRFFDNAIEFIGRIERKCTDFLPIRNGLEIIRQRDVIDEHRVGCGASWRIQ